MVSSSGSCKQGPTYEVCRRDLGNSLSGQPFSGLFLLKTSPYLASHHAMLEELRADKQRIRDLPVSATLTPPCTTTLEPLLGTLRDTSNQQQGQRTFSVQVVDAKSCVELCSYCPPGSTGLNIFSGKLQNFALDFG